MDTLEIAQRARVATLRPLLDWHERQIEAAGQELAKKFKALKEDKQKPYLLTHATFDLYCADRWNMTTRRVQQMLAGETMRVLLLEEAPQLADRVESMKERGLREIATTEPELRVEVFEEAASTPGKITAAKVKGAKAKVLKRLRKLIEPVDAEYQPIEPKVESVDANPKTVECCPHCKRPL